MSKNSYEGGSDLVDTEWALEMEIVPNGVGLVGIQKGAYYESNRYMHVFPLGKKERTEWTIFLAASYCSYKRYNGSHGFLVVPLGE